MLSAPSRAQRRPASQRVDSEQQLDMSSTQLDDAVLVIEVLSASTEGTDRREKLVAYRTLPGLVEYVLISQDRAHVDVHRRRGDIGWERIECAAGDIVRLASVELDISMREIYEGVQI